MAEFCLSCWNQLNDTALTEQEVILSQELDFCECCEQLRPVLVRMRRNIPARVYDRLYALVWRLLWRR